MNVQGRYNIYKNGKLEYVSPNLITENGKSILLQYLAGTIQNWSSYISVGAYNTTASTSDYKLYYEITRLPILYSTPFDSTTSLVTSSGTVGSTSVTVSSSSALGLGYSVSGAGISSSATTTITGISGTRVNISHPVETTFSASTLTFKSAKSIKFRSRINSGEQFSIYELGVTNENTPLAPNEFDYKIITNFTEDVASYGWSSGSSTSSATSYSPRLGGEMLKITATTTGASAALGDRSSTVYQIGSTNSAAGSLLIDTSGYSASYDTAKLLIYASASGASITVTGQDTTTGLTTNTITLIPKTSVSSGGPYIIESIISKGSTYNDILSKIQVSASTSSGSVDLYLDSLKFSKTEDLSVYSGLISRSVLSTPILKAAEETIEIEYELFLFP